MIEFISLRGHLSHVPCLDWKKKKRMRRHIRGGASAKGKC